MNANCLYAVFARIGIIGKHGLFDGAFFGDQNQEMLVIKLAHGKQGLHAFVFAKLQNIDQRAPFGSAAHLRNIVNL